MIRFPLKHKRNNYHQKCKACSKNDSSYNYIIVFFAKLISSVLPVPVLKDQFVNVKYLSEFIKHSSPLGGPAEDAALLRRLSQGLKASIRFAFRGDGRTFLGATPERLVRKQGREVETEAQAGSLDSRAAAAALLASEKDLREHQLVVDDIVSRLGPWCARLEASPRPTVRELRDVLHLLTPIAGTLAAPHHVLELVRELHPTPAVGGVPTAAAVEWITRHEAPRGWYAGPVGYFDRDGDGDFAVALRCCLLHGEEALLFAGAGIVADSDPELELRETELKRQTLLAALLS